MERTSLNNLTAEIAKILGVDEVNPDVPLGQLGIDSINVVELILVCQQIYPNVLDFESLTFDEHTTLREIDERMAESAATDSGV
jgi:acyl carrier protein